MSVDAATLFAITKNGTIASFNGGGDCFIVGAHFAPAGNHAIILLGALPPLVDLEKESDKWCFAALWIG